MTLLQLLSAAAGIPAQKLRELIEAAAAVAPDLADEAQQLLQRLDAALTPEALAALGSTISGELHAILSGKFDPGTRRPSDAA